MFAKLEGLEKKYMELEQALAQPDVYNDQDQYRKLTKAHADLRDVVELFRRHRSLTQELEENKQLLHDSDPDIKAMAQEEIAAAEAACAEAGVKALVGKIATGDLFVGDSETKAAIEAKCAPDCVEMEGAAVSQIAAKNGVPCVILRAMSDNADEDGHEVLVVKKFSISEYVATATKIVAAMVEKL